MDYAASPFEGKTELAEGIPLRQSDVLVLLRLGYAQVVPFGCRPFLLLS